METSTAGLVPVLLLTLTSALSAQGEKVGWRSLKGEQAPDISASTWFNVGDQVASAEALQGKVWLLEFFATW
ncbi:MAG: hypothetical protein R3F56_20050 [Planctomycetota bacterium]